MSTSLAAWASRPLGARSGGDVCAKLDFTSQDRINSLGVYHQKNEIRGLAVQLEADVNAFQRDHRWSPRTGRTSLGLLHTAKIMIHLLEGEVRTARKVSSAFPLIKSTMLSNISRCSFNPTLPEIDTV